MMAAILLMTLLHLLSIVAANRRPVDQEHRKARRISTRGGTPHPQKPRE
jgi:hypothetical protein